MPSHQNNKRVDLEIDIQTKELQREMQLISENDDGMLNSQQRERFLGTSNLTSDDGTFNRQHIFKNLLDGELSSVKSSVVIDDPKNSEGFHESQRQNSLVSGFKNVGNSFGP